MGASLLSNLRNSRMGFAVAKQFVLGLIDMNRALSAQPRHAKGPTQRDLDPGDIEWQGMKIEKPLADKVPDIL